MVCFQKRHSESAFDFVSESEGKKWRLLNLKWWWVGEEEDCQLLLLMELAAQNCTSACTRLTPQRGGAGAESGSATRACVVLLLCCLSARRVRSLRNARAFRVSTPSRPRVRTHWRLQTAPRAVLNRFGKCSAAVHSGNTRRCRPADKVFPRSMSTDRR